VVIPDLITVPSIVVKQGDSVYFWLPVLTLPLYPLSSQRHYEVFKGIYGWRGELKREGAEPPLKFSPPLLFVWRLRGASAPLSNFPPLKQEIFEAQLINLFERGIKGVSVKNQPYSNNT
jgi:hypothetical protein